MKILYLVPYAPTRIRTRPYNLCLSLQRAGHDLTLGTCHESQAEEAELESFRQAGIQVIEQPLGKRRMAVNLITALFSGQPLQSLYSWQPALFQQIWAEIQRNRYDVVHIEHLRGAIYGIKLRQRLADSGMQIPVVWDSVDCISYLFEQASRLGRNAFGRIVTRLELRRTKKFEASLGGWFDRILITSQADARAFEQLEGFAPSHPVEILPNGVDLEYFRPDGTSPTDDRLVFTGKLSYHANVAAALHLVREIMPIIWQSQPATIVQLVGKDPDRALRDLAASDARVQVTGTVADIRPYIRKAAVAVAPIQYGAGIQNKVLEAMACGTAVVAYPIAVAGLPGIRAGEEILLADSPSEFSRLVLQLFTNTGFRKALSDKAYDYVCNHCSWDGAAGRLAAIYRDAIERLHT